VERGHDHDWYFGTCLPDYPGGFITIRGRNPRTPGKKSHGIFVVVVIHDCSNRAFLVDEAYLLGPMALQSHNMDRMDHTVIATYCCDPSKSAVKSHIAKTRSAPDFEAHGDIGGA
jgi:hypothetical protein